MTEQAKGFNPETMVAVHHYRELGDWSDLASFHRAMDDCADGAPNAGKEVCFEPGCGSLEDGAYDMSRRPYRGPGYTPFVTAHDPDARDVPYSSNLYKPGFGVFFIGAGSMSGGPYTRSNVSARVSKRD